MAKGFKFGGGGSPSAGLNFKIAGGETAPQNPGENTIWIKTAQTITGWVISPEEPETLSEGLVWLQTGDSEISFNALKKNELRVCLASASIAAGGVLNPVGGAVWNGTSWLDFSTEAVYLYLPGDVCEDLTGGYTAAGLAASSNSSLTAAPAVTYGADSMVILPGTGTIANGKANYKGGIVRTENKIDCSRFSSLIFEGSVEGIGTGTGKLSLWSDMGANQTVNRVQQAELVNGSEGLTVDVSGLEGSYYIGFGFDSLNVQIMVTVTGLRLE